MEVNDDSQNRSHSNANKSIRESDGAVLLCEELSIRELKSLLKKKEKEQAERRRIEAKKKKEAEKKKRQAKKREKDTAEKRKRVTLAAAAERANKKKRLEEEISARKRDARATKIAEKIKRAEQTYQQAAKVFDVSVEEVKVGDRSMVNLHQQMPD